MAFRSSQQARCYYDTVGLAAYARSLGANAVVDMHDITVLTDTAKKFTPGSDTSTFSLSGPLDSDGEGFTPIETLKAAGTEAPVTYMPLGVDGAAWLFDAYNTQLDTAASHSGTADWTIAAQTSGITDMNGVILENDSTVTDDTDGTANNNGAGTSNGAVFHLHVTAYTGLTSDAIIVEGSATGSFGGEETTIASFASVTGVTSERVEVTGTVPRYLRVVDNVTGTGSITRLVAVSRR